MNQLRGWRKQLWLVGISFACVGLLWALYESFVLRLPEHTAGTVLSCEFAMQLGFFIVMAALYPFAGYNASAALTTTNHTLYAIAWFLAMIFVIPALAVMRLEILPFVVVMVARLVTHSGSKQNTEADSDAAPNGEAAQ